MEKQPLETSESSSNAFQVWMGQWRLATLDTPGYLFVLRFVLNAFRSRKPEDRFWRFLEQFFRGAREESGSRTENQDVRQLLTRASGLEAAQARALLSHLSESYAPNGERLFWKTLFDAVQLYGAAPAARA